MLFGFETQWGEPCKSVTTVEPESFYPRRLPVEYAKILAQEDPAEELFKIFVYPDHCEVWDIRQWNLSASKRMALVQKCNRNTAEYEKAKAAAAAEYTRTKNISNALIKIWPALEYDPKGLLTLVRTLSKAPRELTDKFPGVTEIVHPVKHNEDTV